MTSSNHDTGCRVLGRRIAAARNDRRRGAPSTWTGYGKPGTWSQAWVAEKVGISRSSLALIERGARAPSRATWQALAALLELDAGAVVTFTPQHHTGLFVRARLPAAGGR